MTATTQDPVGRYILLAEKVRRIGEEQGPRHGIGRLVHLSICYMFLIVLRTFASLAERAHAGTLPDPAPAPSRTAAADRPADEADPRVRAPANAGADHRRAAAAPQRAPAMPDARGQASEPAAAAAPGSCAQRKASTPTWDTSDHRSRVLAVPSEATGRTNRAIRKNGFATAGRTCAHFVTITKQ